MDALSWIYALLVGSLCLLGLHRYVHLARFLRLARREPPVPPMPAELPVVTVQLPVFNERDVVARLVDAAASLDWPPERLHLQLLDDSTDDTAACAQGALHRARARGISVELIQRRDRAGFKAGALAHGLASAPGELVAIFDADFVPPRDFLRQLVPHFSDPAVGMVQARWGHLNAEDSALTRAQALMLDAHFRLEHLGRNRAGAWFNFNGTAGVWRRETIEAAGGWAGDTLTEDLDLSYRAQAAGWRFVYRDDVVVPAELPATLGAFRAQQSRWAKGSVETLRKLWRPVLRAPVPGWVRAEAFQHLGANLAWPMALGVALLMPAVALTSGGSTLGHLLLDLPAFLLATVSHAAFFAAAPLAGDVTTPSRAGWRRLADLPAAVLLGVGMSVSQSRAVGEALLGRRSAFVRTPKQGAGAGSYRISRAGGAPVEGLLCLWHLVGFGGALALGHYGSLPFLALFAGGFGWVAVAQERRAAVPSTAPAEALAK
ncbi:MAG: glycosyltransferase [Deltaproteobacteria bacterium]|nr:glycosyltransferase [Deltaproteobacteria bacterium]